jgi:SAM-dependent methyltransferase
MSSPVNARIIEEILHAWSGGLTEEVEFWRQMISGETENEDVKRWAEGMKDRATIFTETKEYMSPILSGRDLSITRILDVGSGPVTDLGGFFGGVKLDITACDPLAPQYNTILDRYGIVAKIKTQKASAELLGQVFQQSEFDVVHCFNALDHSYDPFLGMAEMVKVCRPNGVVFIGGVINEASRMDYFGLHQWNFEVTDENDVEIWRPGIRIGCRKYLSDMGVKLVAQRVMVGTLPLYHMNLTRTNTHI